MNALREHLLAGRAIPLLVLLVRDLALDEKLREFAALRLALEWHVRKTGKKRAEAILDP
jgi:hypothetical protein